MSWDRDSLWSKSKLYFERAFEHDREDDVFGLWCSLGLELLSRAAVAHFSPTLLAEPDREHRYLLMALNIGTTRGSKKSIATNQVLGLCKQLIPEFTEAELKIASALTGRRNEELHSGTVAFEEYPTQQWISGFYSCCKVLAESQEEDLETLFGADEAQTAEKIISEVAQEIQSKVLHKIAAYKKVFEDVTNGVKLIH